MVQQFGKDSDNDTSMLFAAFFMILVGVLCFLYVAFAPTRSAQTGTSSKKSAYSGSFQMPSSNPVSSQVEERIRRERQVTETTPFFEEEIIEKPLPPIVESEMVLKPNEEGELEEEKVSEVRFQISGTLFMDHSAKLEFGEKSEDLENLSETVKNFKRVGLADLQERQGTFQFRSGNVTYTYQAEELDQVILHHQGIVFQLKNTTAPRPVFFTKEINSFKSFLEQAEKSAG